MHLERLEISGLRNLKATKLLFSPSLNLIVGDNGSGKTSLLEAIYLLGRGRSFRTAHLGAVINRNHHTCIVAGELLSATSTVTRVGVARQVEGGFQFRINRKPVASASQLASALPLLLINSDSFSLLDGGPGSRRRYLDWALFHVEQSSQGLAKDLIRILKQRNSLLRRGKINEVEFDYWNKEFSKASEQIHALRGEVFSQLSPRINSILNELGGVDGVEYSYFPGWDVKNSLKQQLSACRSREVKQGRTLIGPHRADIRILVHGKAAKDVLSRGQSKILVSAMHLAQAQLLASATGISPVALVDDLPAELDDAHRVMVIKALMASGAQVFLTGVNKESLVGSEMNSFAESVDMEVFHVEQGVIAKQQTGLL